MAGNNSLQMLRGTSSAISASTATLLAGQPLYDLTNNLLYVGDGSTTQIKNKTPINAGGLYSTSAINISASSTLEMKVSSFGSLSWTEDEYKLELGDSAYNGEVMSTFWYDGESGVYFTNKCIIDVSVGTGSTFYMGNGTVEANVSTTSTLNRIKLSAGTMTYLNISPNNSIKILTTDIDSWTPSNDI